MSKRTIPTKQSAQPIRLPVFTEAEFLQQLIQAARLYGWYVYHVYDSRLTSEAGYPDLTLCHPTVFRHPRSGKVNFFLVEAKIEGGTLRPAQKQWIAACKGNEVEVCIWKPTDVDEIIDRLNVA